MITKIKGGKIISNRRITENPNIYLVNGSISFEPISADCEIDAGDCFITPGLIDIHSHGALMRDFTEGLFEAYDEISSFQCNHGVTAMLATTLTMPTAEILRCADLMRSCICDKKAFSGAQILGLHLEGPFLSKKNKGAHSKKYLLTAELENYASLLDYTDVIKTITVAPDTTGSIEMISRFCERGVVVSGGHDDSYETLLREAIKAGMSHTTHLFCAMSMQNRRVGEKHLGLTELALLDDNLTVELIADGVHVTKSMAQLAFKCKGADKICLVSDMLRVGGMPLDEKIYTLEIPGVDGGLKIFLDNRAARLAGSELNAGSITPLDKMIRNMVSWGFLLEDAIEMASGTPASVLHENDIRGALEEGKRADIAVWSSDLQVIRTIVNGNTVYEK